MKACSSLPLHISDGARRIGGRDRTTAHNSAMNATGLSLGGCRETLCAGALSPRRSAYRNRGHGKGRYHAKSRRD